MKKGIIITVIVTVLIFIIGSFTLYFFATNSLNTEKEEAIQKAKAETDLAEVEEVDWFHYTDHYYVIKGANQSGEKIIVWVPEDENEKITVKNSNEGLTEEKVIDIIYNGLNELSHVQRPKEILNIKLGMVEQVPAYEITYKDQQDRYSILYVDFYNGEWYRVYNL